MAMTINRWLRVLTWLASVNAMPLEAGMAQHDLDDSSTIAARVATLALAASIPWREPLARAEWLWVTDGETLSTEALIEKLRRVPKPVECEAARLGGNIAVTCVPVTKESLLSGLRRMNAKRVRLRDKYGSGRDDLQVLVEMAGESLMVPGTAIECFLDDYWLSHSNIGFSPAAGVLAAGAAVLMTVSPSHGSMTLDAADVLPPKDE
jgi:hypothetical protein